MGCLGTSCSRCLAQSSEASSGVAIQDGALTWLDIDAGCWLRDELGTWTRTRVHSLSYVAFIPHSMTASFWERASQCEPSKRPKRRLPTSYTLVSEVPAQHFHFKPVPTFKRKRIRLCHPLDVRSITQLQRGKELIMAPFGNQNFISSFVFSCWNYNHSFVPWLLSSRLNIVERALNSEREGQANSLKQGQNQARAAAGLWGTSASTSSSWTLGHFHAF